jgi:hypothetical protein
MTDWINLIKTKELQPDEVDVVIYHSPCADGTGSAYVAWKYFMTKFPEKNILYYPMRIDAMPPPDIENKNVLICDYSYKKDILINLLKKVNKLLIIDHHKSAEKDLQDIDDKYKIFHMKYSGAMLTWFYFFPTVKAPLMIEYIQDRDIWTKKLPNTDDFASWFYTLKMDFQEYDKYLDDNLLLEMIGVKGLAFRELNNYYIDQAVNYCVPKFCKLKDKYYFVAYVNSTVCKSDIGNKIFEKYPLIDFSSVYNIDDNCNNTHFSLRSTEKHVDVSEIATAFGCGGHAMASGIKVTHVTNQIPGIYYDNGQLYHELQNIYYGTLIINRITYDVVYMQSSIHKTKLATYFLQDKYTYFDKPVQVCQDISRKLEKVCPDTVQIAAVWNYNPVRNVTHFSIVLHKSISPKEKLIISNWAKCELKNGLTYDDLHTFIQEDTSLIKKWDMADTDID